jgi:hypothetical protein
MATSAPRETIWRHIRRREELVARVDGLGVAASGEHPYEVEVLSRSCSATTGLNTSGVKRGEMND